MYFDFDYYWQVVRHVWGLKGWRGRNNMLLRLLVITPVLLVINSLCFLLDYVLFPALWRQQVRQPVFIVGHARSGTTLMHRLMTADGDKFSYFLYWEMFFPSLLQKKIIRGLGWIDQQLLGGPIKRALVRWDNKTFGPYRHMHHMSLWNSEEDQFAMQAAFVTQQWSLDIPLMDKLDIFHVDQMLHKRQRWLRHYKELVKRQLLLNGGDKIHLSKNPVMSGWVESIIETFPDARIVVMMRDPKQCIPSVLKLVESTWKGKRWSKAQYQLSLDALQAISFDTFKLPRKVLADHPQTPQCVVDYRQLTSDPKSCVESVYAALNIELSASFDRYLTAQAEKEKSHHSKFEYSLGEYDLDEQLIEQELAEFYPIYQWPREHETVDEE
ncbi:sulfotransferase [Oceanicoccus sp. KOV_DT_Chl]|uniref:sulfotransferase family protein n=1 Tax=Oceanicoccus sp. KOV_DT_Chl TaxID=1904639 RepID=UPI000C7C89DD|nr:sulfotransferase [Oceanicoccus sp. KOV_DT_Chl]